MSGTAPSHSDSDGATSQTSSLAPVPNLVGDIPPDIFARRKFVGAGGFGNVYRLEHPTLGVLALKQVKEAGSKAEINKQRRSARSEASIWFGLEHPHILELVGIVESETAFCLVCPFLQRGSLRDYIRENPEASIDRIEIVAQCLDALSYLHQRSIIHGDIKAANVLLSDDLRAQICDFGLSRSTDVSTSTSKRGQGSLRWMSPELFNNGGRKSFASDVWAVGMMIYEIISGNLPYEDLTEDMSIMLGIFNHSLPLMEPAYSPGGASYQAIWTMVADCWKYDPGERPTMDALHQTLRAPGSQSQTPSLPISSRGPSTRNNIPDEALADSPHRKRVTVLSAHTLGICCVAFSSDSRTLVSSSDDTTIRLWDVSRGVPLGDALKGPTSSPVDSVAFSPHGSTLVSGFNDGSIGLWDVATGRMKGEPLLGHAPSVWGVAFAPDGRTFASASADKTIRIWDATSRACVVVLSGHLDWVNTVAYSPDGKTLVSGSDDCSVRLWDVASPTGDEQPLVGIGHRDWVRSVAFSPDGSTVASGSSDGTVRLWDVQSAEPKGPPLEGHSDQVWCVAFHPGGNLLASGSKDHIVRLWDLKTTPPTTRLELKEHTHWVRSVAFSLDGRYLASGSLDKTVRLWDLELLLGE